MASTPIIGAPYTPKQVKEIVKNKVDAYERTGGEVTAQFASACLELVPPITSHSVIHDNACGSGTVASKIVAANPPQGFKIYATDHDDAFIVACQDNIKAHAWPAEAQAMKCEKLDFPDEHFTHSFTNVAIFMTANGGLDAAKEIYRTLKPGGTATVNCWQLITWVGPMKEVHESTRPSKPWPSPVMNWSDGKRLWDIMEEAGFKKENMKATTSDAWATTTEDGLRSWAETSWAYLGGMGGWSERDEELWDDAVSLLEKKLREAQGTSISSNGEVKMIAKQHVVVATK